MSIRVLCAISSLPEQWLPHNLLLCLVGPMLLCDLTYYLQGRCSQMSSPEFSHWINYMCCFNLLLLEPQGTPRQITHLQWGPSVLTSLKIQLCQDLQNQRNKITLEFVALTQVTSYGLLICPLKVPEALKKGSHKTQKVNNSQVPGSPWNLQDVQGSSLLKIM